MIQARESKCLRHQQLILVQENSKTKIKQDSCKDCILDMLKKKNCSQLNMNIRELIENEIWNLQLKISYLSQQKKIYKRQTDFITQTIEQDLFRPCTEVKEIQKQQENKQQIDAIDIIFILDCTKSMKAYILELQDNICAIIEDFKKNVPAITVRIAAVCYRDLDVQPQHILYHDFTSNVQLIQNFIEMNEAKGGEDIPDDLVGGLEGAYKLDISKNKDSILQLLIITDAPCHGKSYHNLMIDLHSKGQDGKLEDILLKFKELKLSLFVTFFQIAQITRKMELIMEKTLINSFNLVDVTNSSLKDEIKKTLLQSFQQGSKIQKNTFKNNLYLREATLTKQGKMKFNYDQHRNEQTYMNYFNRQFDTEQISYETKLEIETNEVKFGTQESGKRFSLFKAYDIKQNRFDVLKIPKYIVEQYQKQQQNKEQISIAESEAKMIYKQQVIAVQLAQEFNLRIKEKQLQKEIFPIYYASPKLYKFKEPFYGLNLIYGETYINCENMQWIKYSNNYDYANPSFNLPSFSHFTYEVTNHEIMITNLQGKVNLLTDPAMHTNNDELISSDDCHQMGINLFFQAQHQTCEIICQKLNISVQIEIMEIMPTWDIKVDYENLYMICSQCGRQDDYQEEHPDYCNQCNSVSKCRCCKYIFEEDNIDQFCKSCHKEGCFSSNLKCQYCKQKICHQFKHRFMIDKKEIILCQDGVQYLNQLKCLKCNKQYSYQTNLTEQSYRNGQYYCC